MKIPYFIMNLFLLLCLISLTTCEDLAIYPDPEEAKPRKKSIFSSSDKPEPYAFINYEYDKNWNLIKESCFNYPKPINRYYLFEYDKQNRLSEKKEYYRIGLNTTDQTEKDLSLHKKYMYTYPSKDRKIEKIYVDGIFDKKTEYQYNNNKLSKESHFDENEEFKWFIIYNYDSQGRLIKKTETSGQYTTYEYNYDGLLNRFFHFDSDGKLLVTNIIIYKDSNRIKETHYEGPYGTFISEKETYKNGLLIEYIKYHPTFPGAEWFCYRYEYF